MENKQEEKAEKGFSVEQTLQKTFGADVVNVNVDVESQLSESVSMFLRAMDEGQNRVSQCKIAFGELESGNV